jgi:hypothetical protein
MNRWPSAIDGRMIAGQSSAVRNTEPKALSCASTFEDEVVDHTAPGILIHLHIHKTAGTSLNSLVKHNFSRGRVFEWPSRPDKSSGLDLGACDSVKQKLQEFGLNRLEYISGHVPFGIHEMLPVSTKYFTLVRNPVERIVSLFYWRQQSPKSVMPPFHAKGRPLSFEELIESGDIHLDNFQVRVLSGASELNPTATSVPGELNFASPVARIHLEQAKDNIEKHFITAALTERITECVFVLRSMYCWPMWRLYSEKKNLNRHRPAIADIPARLKWRIEKTNAYDIELCDWIDKRFDEQRKRLELELSRDLHRHNALNGCINFIGAMVPTGVKRTIVKRFLWR